MIGSFLNVIIHRLPLSEDIIFKRSHCPSCHKNIPWYLNLPLVGYILLLGKCRSCKEPISFRYFFIEILAGLAALFLFPGVITNLSLLKFVVFYGSFCLFICHIFIDLKHQILPDSLNLVLFILLGSYSVLSFDYIRTFLGFLIGFGGTWLITYLFYKLRGQIGLGGGDIKLFGILGLFLGPVGILYNLFLSCFLGAIIALVQISIGRMKKSQPMPFGPFIILVAMAQIYFPEAFFSFLTKLGFNLTY